MSRNPGVNESQSGISGDHSGNNHSNNIIDSIIHYGTGVLSDVPRTFQELIRHAGRELSPTEIDLDYLNAKHKLPEDKTREWIFTDAEYLGWLGSRESRLLWLCGGPGTGKTMLAKRVAADLLKELADPPREVGLVFHFVSPELPTNGASTEKTDPPQPNLQRPESPQPEPPQPTLANVARSLLYCILRQNGKLSNGCMAALRTQGDRFFSNPYSLWGVVGKAIQDCGRDPVYILIDGVDGLQESLCGELIGRILALEGTGTVKIFLSSRDVPHVSNNLHRYLGRAEYTKINLDTNSSVKKDVETFIRHRVSAWRWSDNMEQRAIDTLLKKSEGIFLWAPLAIEDLAQSSTGADLETILRELPKKLKEKYGKILNTLKSRSGSEQVLNMIRCVALAPRPLTFGELGHMLACMEENASTERQPSRGVTSSGIQLRTEEEVRSYVTSSLGFLRVTNNTVSIIHHTATEYLFKEPPESEADLTTSWGCFQYLHRAFLDPKEFPNGNGRGPHYRFRDPGSERDHQEESGERPWEAARRDPQGAVAQWPYLKYAAEFWVIYARRSIKASSDRFCEGPDRNWLQYQFFESREVVRGPWFELCGDPEMKILAEEQTQLHIAVCLGLMPLVEKALANFIQGAEKKRLPLHLAAKLRSRVGKTLIAKGVHSLLTAQDRNGNTPLRGAATSSHSPLLEALVAKLVSPEYKAYSSEINQQNNCGNTPLHLAVQFDHLDIVEFLVKNGADPTIKNDVGKTALKLGEESEKGDSLSILKQAENIWEARNEITGRPLELLRRLLRRL